MTARPCGVLSGPRTVFIAIMRTRGVGAVAHDQRVEPTATAATAAFAARAGDREHRCAGGDRPGTVSQWASQLTAAARGRFAPAPAAPLTLGTFTRSGSAPTPSCSARSRIAARGHCGSLARSIRPARSICPAMRPLQPGAVAAVRGLLTAMGQFPVVRCFRRLLPGLSQGVRLSVGQTVLARALPQLLRDPAINAGNRLGRRET